MNKPVKQAIHYGRELFLSNVNNGANGNISLKCGQEILITRSGSLFSELNEKDFVNITDKDASSEKDTHQALYNSYDDINAIMHTHPPSVIALSLRVSENIIKPIDLEGKYYFNELPVISTELIPGAKDLPVKLTDAVKGSKAVIVKGHGLFTVGQTIKECYLSAVTVANICNIIFLK